MRVESIFYASKCRLLENIYVIRYAAYSHCFTESDVLFYVDYLAELYSRDNMYVAMEIYGYYRREHYIVLIIRRSWYM